MIDVKIMNSWFESNTPEGWSEQEDGKWKDRNFKGIKALSTLMKEWLQHYNEDECQKFFNHHASNSLEIFLNRKANDGAKKDNNKNNKNDDDKNDDDKDEKFNTTSRNFWIYMENIC